VSAAETPGASTEGMGAAGYYDAHSEYQRRVIEAGEEWIEAMMTALDLGAAGPASRSWITAPGQAQRRSTR
jgi:hypothetical protein